ncbi:uncharacterized protein LOC133778016 isoform X2 [Humulus lupulus]|uniref:uncharacterized protein LOC133778016 isoform X2 n=1 Tax=Humulus lupulus TaxID=3486 RepID=UPI002B40F361|nr:uncharacterized protein LOC133778016 isoform X2 [Humulus lupulus]
MDKERRKSQSRKEEPVKAEEVVVLIESEADDESRVTTVEETREEGKADNQKTSQESSTSKGDQSGDKTGELPVSSEAEVKDAESTSEKGAKSAPSSEAKKKKSVKKKPQQQQQKVPS